MSVDLRTVDEIVQKVMDQLRSGTGSASPSRSSVSAPGSTAAPIAKEERLVLGDRVITGAILEEKLSGQKVLVVGSRAIVTPTARDIIRQRELRLVRDGGPGESLPKAADGEFC